LQRALKACARRYRHNRHKRLICQLSARARYARGTRGHRAQMRTSSRHDRRAK
jgi:hypothetical protein